MASSAAQPLPQWDRERPIHPSSGAWVEKANQTHYHFGHVGRALNPFKPQTPNPKHRSENPFAIGFKNPKL